MTNRRRILAGLLCAALALCLFVSSAYMVREARHECVGEQCEICENMLRIQTLVRRLGFVGAILLLLLSARRVMDAVPAASERRETEGRTLIGWKVRLNN